MKNIKIIDLSKPLDESLTTYSDQDYSDPEFKVTAWSQVEQQGFQVSKLELGTQTGTHIDAPAHFIAGGATLEALATNELIGDYFLVDINETIKVDQLETLFAKHQQQKLLFLRTKNMQPQKITKQALTMLLLLPIKVWIVAGQLEVIDEKPLEFHHALAKAGKFLIENLSDRAMGEIPKNGELIALPLKLSGTSGAPCRVIIRS